MILNTLVRGLYDSETREGVLSKEPQMDLKATTILFIEAMETGKRSAGVLSGNTIASNTVDKASVATDGVSQSRSEVDKSLSCKNCVRTGHGKSWKQSCSAWDQECFSSKKGQFKKCCNSKSSANVKNRRFGGSSLNVKNMKPSKHEVFATEAAVHKEQLPLKHAEISVTMQVDVQAFLDHKPKLPCAMVKEFCVYSMEKLKWVKEESKAPPSIELVADTEVKVDIIGEEQLVRIGFLVRDLLPTRVSLNYTNHTKTGVVTETGVVTRPSQHHQHIPQSQDMPDTPAQHDPPLHQPQAQQHGDDPGPVSYTHLTLPTILLV